MILNFEKSTKFTQDLVKFEDEKLYELEKKSIEENVPIITREVLKYMMFMANSIKAKNILEIGTAVGYSSIFLSKIANKNEGRLTTIEIDENRYSQAISNFESFNIDNVEAIRADALEALPRLKAEDRKYDFIFIDASKSKYTEFFDYSYSMLNKGGLIFIDNIMFRGLVVEEDMPKKYRTIIRNLKDFISSVNEKYNFVLLPFGDGVGLVYKEEK